MRYNEADQDSKANQEWNCLSTGVDSVYIVKLVPFYRQFNGCDVKSIDNQVGYAPHGAQEIFLLLSGTLPSCNAFLGILLWSEAFLSDTALDVHMVLRGEAD